MPITKCYLIFVRYAKVIFKDLIIKIWYRTRTNIATYLSGFHRHFQLENFTFHSTSADHILDFGKYDKTNKKR